MRHLTYEIEVNAVLAELPSGTFFAGQCVRLGAQSSPKQVRVFAQARPVMGEVWRITGRWAQDEIGYVLHGIAAERTLPTGALVVPFLRKRVPGLGQVRAERLRGLGGDLFTLLDQADIERLARVVEPQFPGISLRIATALVSEWSSLRAEIQAYDWLECNGVVDVRVATRIVAILGDQVRIRLASNPYILAAFLPWSDVDKTGLAILRRRPSSGELDVCDAPERLVGAVASILRSVIQDGSTALTDRALRNNLAHMVGPNRVDRAIAVAERHAVILRSSAGWRAAGCAQMEDSLRQRFTQMTAGAWPGEVAIPERTILRTKLEELMSAGRPQLSDEQQDAVLDTIEQPLSVIVGYAGCGKTTALEMVCRLWQSLGGRIEVAALSGIASLRASRATSRVTGRPARTIFRLLQELKASAEPARTTQPSVRLDSRTLLIVDEASMVGLSDWHRIVSAMAPGCRLLMSGDPMQLPPIDFGLVFHRLADEAEQVSCLTHVFRQDDTTGIPLVAQAIRKGTKPTFSRFNGRSRGVSFIEVDNAEIPETIMQVADDLGDTGEPLLIIAPTKRGPSGVHRLNALCHEQFLARQAVPGRLSEVKSAEVKGYYGNRFAVGEPVIHIENDYKRGLFNGSLGFVSRIDPDRRSVIARFEGYQEEFEFTSQTLIRLALAYAVSCHKAQGTQIDRVIIPVYSTPLLDRAWLYTAVTRAVHQVVLVGSRSVLEQALDRPTEASRRMSGFRGRQDYDHSGQLCR